MLRAILLISSAALLLGFSPEVASAGTGIVGPPAFTRVAGTPVAATTLELHMQISSTMDLPVQVTSAPVSTVGWRRRYGAAYAPYAGYRPYYRGYYAPSYAYGAYYGYRPYAYPVTPYYYAPSAVPYGGAYYGQPAYYGGPVYYGSGYRGVYHW